MCECKVCKVAKVRAEAGLRSGTRGRRYKDASGRDWNGFTCPDCRAIENRERAKQYSRNSGKVRAARAAREMSNTHLYGPAEPLYAEKLRPCRTCKTPNPNYFECGPCLAVKIEPGCLDEDMFALSTGNAGNLAGFHY